MFTIYLVCVHRLNQSNKHPIKPPHNSRQSHIGTDIYGFCSNKLCPAVACVAEQTISKSTHNVPRVYTMLWNSSICCINKHICVNIGSLIVILSYVTICPIIVSDTLFRSVLLLMGICHILGSEMWANIVGRSLTPAARTLHVRKDKLPSDPRLDLSAFPT